MLQANEVARRFGAIEQAIVQAAQLCGSAQEMPMDLKDCINQLEQQKSSVRQAIDSHDDARIRQAVDNLESLGRPRQAGLRHGGQADAGNEKSGAEGPR